MRKGRDNDEFVVDLEDGALSLGAAFKELTSSPKARAPYFEKTLQTASGAKIVVSGIEDPADKTKCKNLKVTVSREGGLKEENVNDAITMIMSMGLKVIAVGTKKPGYLRDVLNDNLVTVTAKRQSELLVENQNLMQRVVDWEKKYRGYFQIPIVKAILDKNPGAKNIFDQKVEELRAKHQSGSTDTASLKKLNLELLALVKLLPEMRDPRDVMQLSSIPKKMQSFTETSKAAPSADTSEEAAKKDMRQVELLRKDNEELFNIVEARIEAIDQFIETLDQGGYSKRVGKDVRAIREDLVSRLEELDDEGATYDMQTLKRINLDLRAMAITLPEVLPKDKEGNVKEKFSEREVKVGLKDIKEFPKKIERFVEEVNKSALKSAKLERPAKIRAPSWSGVKEKLQETLPGLAGALAKLSNKQKSDVSQEAKKGPDEPGPRDSSMKK